MAKNWTMKEALEAVKNNDKAGIQDLGKRFPNVAVALAKIGNNEGAEIIINGLPEHVTARKVEAQLKGDIDEDVNDDVDVEDTDEDEVVEKKSTRGRKKKSATSDEDKKAAARERARKRREAKKAAKVEEPDEDEFDEDDEDEETDPYAGKNAVELFKLCKSRGIKAQPKQKAADYIKLLKKADEASDDSDEDEEEDDDWDI